MSGHKMLMITKPIASTAFVVFALHQGALLTAYGRAILVALCLSWCGDLFLISESRRCFLAGLGSFLLAHAAFVTAFVIRGVDPRWSLAAGFVLILVAAAIARWLLPHVERSSRGMKGPVIAYMGAVSFMAVCAVGAAAASGNSRIAVGAIAFFISDISVARDRFVAPGVINRAWGLPVYYAAQFLLASTVAIH